MPEDEEPIIDEEPIELPGEEPDLDPDADTTDIADAPEGDLVDADADAGMDPDPGPSADPIHAEFGDYLDPEEENPEPVDSIDLYDSADVPEDADWDAVPEGPDPPPAPPITDSSTENDRVEAMDETDFEVEAEAPPETADADPVAYEIQGRPSLEADYTTLMRVDAAQDTADLYGLPVGAEWAFRVRAVFVDGTFGEWSADAAILLPEDMLAPGIPSLPRLTPGFGLASVEWDGLTSTGDPMPPDFKQLVVWHSLTGEAGTWNTRGVLTAPGALAVTDLPVNVPQFFAFSARDLTGNESMRTAPVSVTLVPLVEELSISEALDDINTRYSGVIDDAAQLDGALADAQEQIEVTAGELENLRDVRLPAAEDKITAIETVNLPALDGRITDEAAATLLAAQQDATDKANTAKDEAIIAANATPITNSRLTPGSLTVWPFAPGTIPGGVIGSNEIADFSLMVTKFKTNRHHLY